MSWMQRRWRKSAARGLADWLTEAPTIRPLTRLTIGPIDHPIDPASGQVARLTIGFGA